LKIPAVVQQATDQYRASQDSFADFISDCCVLESDAWVSSEDLREGHASWSREHSDGRLNDNGLTDKAFAQKLQRFGCSSRKGTGGVRGWSGIRLHSDTASFNDSITDSQTDSVQ
jgi:phage/plasmid-associated DNA primase